MIQQFGFTDIEESLAGPGGLDERLSASFRTINGTAFEGSLEKVLAYTDGNKEEPWSLDMVSIF